MKDVGFDRSSQSDPDAFSPPLLRIQDEPPAPLAGWMLKLLLALVVGAVLWAVLGKLDIVAVADGKLVPTSYLKILQSAEQGIVKEILVEEGASVVAGQVLIRMDPLLTEADVRSLRTDAESKRLALRRIDSQLAGSVLAREKGDRADLFVQASAHHVANVRAYENALAQERSQIEKARNDLAAARETKAKLEQVLPHYREQERAFLKLSQDGFAGRVLATDKQRERIEREQDLKAQEFVIRSNHAVIEQSERKLAQISADYRRQLQTERMEVASQFEKVGQELVKQEHRHRLLELKAPVDGTVKDLATHTIGTVAAPGTILMTLVPRDEKVLAEVWVGNQDVGFVRKGQSVRIKLVPFQFQKYGLVEGKVQRVSADATEAPSGNTRSDSPGGRDKPMGPLAYRALVELSTQELVVDGARYALNPGMQVAAEIHLGTRSVMEYLLSPVKRAWHDAARER